jgi:RHS repeat-associated protein
MALRGRLNGVGSTGRSQSYTYHPLHSRIEAIEWSGASGIQFKERRNYDVAGRLLAIHSDAMPGGVASPVTRYGYQFDNLGRRKKAVLVDGSTWDYGYNDRGEVTSAARKDAAGTTIPALGATYAYDGIGNRTTSTSPVLGQRTYTPNNLNQYSSITAAPFRTVVGRAPAAAPVAVNGTTLGAQHRTGEVFHFQLPLVSNLNSPVWLPASVSSQGTTIDRHFFVPKQVTAPQHDLDGNLVNDGRWVYLWDAENRLIQMESTVAAVQAGAPYRKLVFRYDAGGRRLARTVYHGTAAAPVFASSTRWLCDGWNPISEFSGTADTGGTITRTKSYTWGLDLSGTPQGAGGVGGLLAVIVHSGFTNSAYYPSYDGNGNIVAWTLEGTPAPVSRREYDAFGNTLVEQGVSPSAYGFSTKMQDAETGLYYYGYRFYDPVTGRWPSRDPIGERGGSNIYGFLANSGVNNVDILGLMDDDGNLKLQDCRKQSISFRLKELDKPFRKSIGWLGIEAQTTTRLNAEYMECKACCDDGTKKVYRRGAVSGGIRGEIKLFGGPQNLNGGFRFHAGVRGVLQGDVLVNGAFSYNGCEKKGKLSFGGTGPMTGRFELGGMAQIDLGWLGTQTAELYGGGTAGFSTNAKVVCDKDNCEALVIGFGWEVGWHIRAQLGRLSYQYSQVDRSSESSTLVDKKFSTPGPIRALIDAGENLLN